MEHSSFSPFSRQDRMELALLLDFYGSCLTSKQQQAAELYFSEDLSLAEIAELTGITRQGVRDCLKKAENALLEKEEQLGLAARHLRQREELLRLQTLVDPASASGQEMLEIIHRLLSE